MTTRTDPHRPGALIPADYRFLFAYAHATTVKGWTVPGFNISLLCAQRTGRPFYAASDADKGEIEPIRDETGRAYPMSAIHKAAGCDSCGAWHIEGSVFLHEPTQECIAVGWQCAEKMELHYDASERAKVSLERKAARLRAVERAARFAALRKWVADNRDLLPALRTDHRITKDIRARLIRKPEWGLSEKQANLVRKLAAEADRPPEKHVPVPVDGERIEVTGTVVSTRCDDRFGSIKMVVKVETADGCWLCWGTAPDALTIGGSELRGTRVTFTAEVRRSDRDAHFGFFKRPTKARRRS